MTNVLLEMIDRQAAVQPQAVAMMEAGRKAATYQDVQDQLRAHLTFLYGIMPDGGARIATLLSAGADTGVFVLACCCGATAMPFNPALSDAEISELARTGMATHLAADATTASRAQPIAHALGIPLIVLSSNADGFAGSATARAEGAATVSPGAIDERWLPARDSAAMALVLHTSGSTDRPKRVPLSLANLVAGSRNVAGSLGLSSSDVVLSMMAMANVGGLIDMLTAVLASGGSVAFAGEVSADSFFRGLAMFRPSWFQAVPAVLADIERRGASEAEMQALRGLRFIRVVAQPLLNGQHLAFEQRFGVPLLPMYGMTEATGVITSMRPGDNSLPGTVGRPHGTEIAIIDSYGNPCEPGAVGEVLIRGPAVMSGYEAIDRAETFVGPWLRTGDQGFIDADGALTLVGRIKELINRGGEKISPLQIERAATLHPGILEVAAFAVPHPSLGEDVAIAIVPRSGSAVDLTSLQGFLRDHLAEYKLPRSLLLLDSLPRVPNGKLDRRALPALAASRPASAADRTPPATNTEKALAALWSNVLDVERPCLEDDFFDLGGDSLSATNLATLIEGRFSSTVATGDLFLQPTLRDMARRIDDGLAASGSGQLRPDIEHALRKAMVSWRGSRHPETVAVTRNAIGDKTPFFWICQSRWQFEPLCEHFSPNRPLHVLSSLSNTGLKSDENNAVLADHYARWIVSKIGSRPILLGGFCQGGLIAFMVAQRLRSMGRRPDIVVLQDRFVPSEYDGAIAFFSGKRGSTSLFALSPHPYPGWARYYSGPLSFHAIEADHDDLHKEPHVAVFARDLEAVLSAVDSGSALPGRVVLPPRDPIDPELMSLRVKARPPRFMRASGSVRVPVTVYNPGKAPLPSTEESGISLAAEWTAFDPREKLALGGRVSIDAPLNPGGRVDLDLTVHMPVRGLPVWLRIDLVEDGAGWLHRERGPARRHIVLPLPAI